MAKVGEYVSRVMEENLLDYIDQVDCSERNKAIVLKYYDGFHHTFDELGREFGITPSRIHQILYTYSVKAMRIKKKNGDTKRYPHFFTIDNTIGTGIYYV